MARRCEPSACVRRGLRGGGSRPWKAVCKCGGDRSHGEGRSLVSCSRGCWALGMAFGAPARTVLQTLGGPDVFTCVGACATDPGRMPEGEPGSGTAKGGAARAVLLSWHRGQPLGGLIRATW